jgi:hypothetical protein
VRQPTTRRTAHPDLTIDSGGVAGLSGQAPGAMSEPAGEPLGRRFAAWVHDRSLTLVMLALFVVFLVGQVVTGWLEFNQEQVDHGANAAALGTYLSGGHPWEALFENWESEFLQMAAFVIFTTFLYQKGSPESRRPGVVELVDVDPRSFADREDVPWPVKRGGWVLNLYEHSLGLVLFTLFILSWIGHVLGGAAEYRSDQQLHGQPAGGLIEYVSSSRFWFESFQNWQSEFLSVAAMIWLAVYLRQRRSPESKPVHAPHAETGR